jgi:hypothetical protein
VSIVALIRRNFTKMWEKKFDVATHSKVFFNNVLEGQPHGNQQNPLRRTPAKAWLN